MKRILKIDKKSNLYLLKIIGFYFKNYYSFLISTSNPDAVKNFPRFFIVSS
jgi:hypothetical protein